MTTAKRYEKIKLTQKRPNANLRSEQWGSLAEMHRQLDSQVTYATFYNRVRKGMDPISAATTPRDKRGRKTGRLPQTS